MILLDENKNKAGVVLFSKLVKLVPQKWLVYMYKHLPFKKFKNWVVYKAQNKFLVSVLGIITNEKGQVLLCKHVYRSEPWGVPGGWMELEKPETALTREIYEETNLKVQITRLEQALYGQNPNRVDLVLSGRIIAGSFKPSAEISEIMYCTVDEWPEGLPAVQKRLIKEILSKS